jgi:hypothetical protein
VDDCARAASGQPMAGAAITLMKSRRRIALPHALGLYCTDYSSEIRSAMPQAIMTYSKPSSQCSGDCRLANAGTQDRIVRPPAVLATPE